MQVRIKIMTIVAMLVCSMGTTPLAAQYPRKLEFLCDSVRMMCSADLPERGLTANVWSTPVGEENRFVVNDRKSNEVAWYTSSGQRLAYQPTTEMITRTNDAGVKYRELGIIDKEGEEFTIMLFDEFLNFIRYNDDGSYLVMQYYYR